MRRALLLLALSAAATGLEARQPAPDTIAAEQQVRAQRAAFNRALDAADVPAIAAILAEDAQLVTGADSRIVAGKAAQLAIWSQDLQGPDRKNYVRTPDRITVSPVGPMALETGRWRGTQRSDAANWAEGDYAAKWRRIDGTWQIESETYMATACGGSFCPTKRWDAK